ncbi:hypothetical protein H5400_24750 [Rhodococcus wratislaviensis]|nr:MULTISPECIES: FGGY family carbohydrate kinase [unclassified Rhodococcus (in: high G+C Gram-positive bacteria)]MBC2642027.1 hypothetical protein [Rhodococcus sp. 3A]MBC2893231.1 hypothetical protein [Rhodococcus sp. 4CII]
MGWIPVPGSQSGKARTQALVWQDRRAEGLCRDLDAHKDMIAARTGLLLESYFSAPKMAWLRRNVETAGVVTTSDTWLLHQLTGAFVTDVTTASRSLAVDLDDRRWNGELLSLFGLEGERLPDIVANDTIVGTTSAFGGDVPVGAPLRWISPGVLRPGDTAPARNRLLLWTDTLVRIPKIVVRQDRLIIARKTLPWPASPGRVFRVPSSVLDKADSQGGPVTVSLG